jgi:hypothetical protein
VYVNCLGFEKKGTALQKNLGSKPVCSKPMSFPTVPNKQALWRSCKADIEPFFTVVA